MLISCIIITFLTGCVKNNFPTTNSNFPTAANNFNSSQKNLNLMDFSQVCNGGKIDEAAAYDKSPDTISPIEIYFQPNAQPHFRDIDSVYPTNFPGDWQSSQLAREKTQLTACVSIKEIKMKKQCTYKDDQDGKSYQLKMYDAKYNFKVYEAKTGNIVAEKDFDLKSDSVCPIVQLFSLEMETENPDYGQTLTNFLKPLVKH